MHHMAQVPVVFNITLIINTLTLTVLTTNVNNKWNEMMMMTSFSSWVELCWTKLMKYKEKESCWKWNFCKLTKQHKKIFKSNKYVIIISIEFQSTNWINCYDDDVCVLSLFHITKQVPIYNLQWIIKDNKPLRNTYNTWRVTYFANLHHYYYHHHLLHVE